MNEFDALAQPTCPECGTVLRDVDAGFECTNCGLLFLRDFRVGGDRVT